MTIGQSLYTTTTRAIEPFLGTVLRRRAAKGKEDAGRINERFARNLMARPSAPIVWLHGASVGESMMLLELARQLQAAHPSIHILMTSQTLTSATLINARISQSPTPTITHQFAPFDTPAIATRFLGHWQPITAIFAESEIWPNLLRELRTRATPTALVNARMTAKSLKGWSKWPSFSRELFGDFDALLAADTQTAEGLSRITGRDVTTPGNLKFAIPISAPDEEAVAALKAGLVSDRLCLVAASTHQTEEAFILDAWEKMAPRPVLIIAPRHPERRADIQALLNTRNITHTVRSQTHDAPADTQVLLADTLGEMALWYELADTVYLGGGQAEGVGGHNPLEPIRQGRHVLTGRNVHNFADIMARMQQFGALRFVDTPAEVANAFPSPPFPATVLQELEQESSAPMTATLAALAPLITRGLTT